VIGDEPNVINRIVLLFGNNTKVIFMKDGSICSRPVAFYPRGICCHCSLSVLLSFRDDPVDLLCWNGLTWRQNSFTWTQYYMDVCDLIGVTDHTYMPWRMETGYRNLDNYSPHSAEVWRIMRSRCVRQTVRKRTMRLHIVLRAIFTAIYTVSQKKTC